MFQAFSRVIRESSRKFVIMDTAPTGQTLLLLDATGSYHKDIMRHQATSGSTRLVTPMMRLQDPDQTKIMIVTLPETTPVLEAAHLQDGLRRAGIEPWRWIINSSLAAAENGRPLLRKCARSEQEEITKVRDDLAKRYAVVPIQAQEPIGAKNLSGSSKVFLKVSRILMLGKRCENAGNWLRQAESGTQTSACDDGGHRCCVGASKRIGDDKFQIGESEQEYRARFTGRNFMRRSGKFSKEHFSQKGAA